MVRNVRGGNRSRYSKREVAVDKSTSCGSLLLLEISFAIGGGPPAPAPAADDADVFLAEEVAAADAGLPRFLADGAPPGDGFPPALLLRLPAIIVWFFAIIL